MNRQYTKLNIIWTFDNPGSFKYIIAPMALTNIRNPDCKGVKITLIGATTKLLVEQIKVQQLIRELIDAGVKVIASEESADFHGVRVELEELGGIEIRHVAKRAQDDAEPGEKIMML